MKNLYWFLLLFSISFGYSQVVPNYQSISIQTAEDCKKVEPQIVECSAFVLMTPSTESIHVLEITKIIMRWMESTPDHTFELGGTVFMSISSDINLVSRYLAAQTITAIKQGSSDKESFKLNYITAFLDYCEKKENQVKLNSKLKKYIKAKNDKTLEALLLKE